MSSGKVRIKALFPWACPKCGADANSHGAKPTSLCDGKCGCQGLICECESDCERDHGQTLDDPCPNANCYHCGWGGTLPKKPRGLQAWEQKALDAGWSAPEARIREIGGLPAPTTEFK